MYISSNKRTCFINIKKFLKKKKIWDIIDSFNVFHILSYIACNNKSYLLSLCNNFLNLTNFFFPSKKKKFEKNC